eukprot:857604-Rhodomonas_salina.1
MYGAARIHTQENAPPPLVRSACAMSAAQPGHSFSKMAITKQQLSDLRPDLRTAQSAGFRSGGAGSMSAAVVWGSELGPRALVPSPAY